MPKGIYKKGLSVKERFLIKINKTKTCWLWTGSIAKKTGYGVLTVNHKSVLAHRLSYEIYKGSSKGFFVLHSCDVRNCVNPNHLRLGTAAENSSDMVKRKRSAPGEKNGNAKLTQAQVNEIRRIRSELGYSTRKIAKMFSVDRVNISFIINNITWKNE